ncbi:conserved membrane hypothetical protein [Hyphomicrobiales bacterium]|nr:conserved membrane hypothetical protein [Hyphomicrobiales bacterium]CAH1663206.1 conserved membrane hypothetical protein [Hyphomicrobiales bacterium]
MIADWLPLLTVLVAVAATGVIYGRATPWPWRLVLPLVGAVVGVGVTWLAMQAPIGPYLSPLVAVVVAVLIVTLSLYLKRRGVG